MALIGCALKVVAVSLDERKPAMVFLGPHLCCVPHDFLIYDGPIAKAQRGCRVRPAVGDHIAGIGVKQAVDLNFEGNIGDNAGADDLLLSRHEHGIELVRLKAGDDLSGLDVLRFERAVALEDLRCCAW